MSTDCLDLLSLSSSSALNIIIQENLKSGVSVNDLIVGDPAPLDNNDMSVQISTKSYSENTTGYIGVVLFDYHRLNYSEVFNQLDLTMQISLPGSTKDLMTKLGEIFDIVFETSDYYNDLIQEPTTPTGFVSYVVRAQPSSKRWFNQFNVKIYKL